MTANERNGAAVHEAGHAAAASALGLTVGEIEIGVDGDDSAGRCTIADSTYLPLVDQIAICLAGLVAQDLFSAFTTEHAAMGDYAKVIDLVGDEMPEIESKRLRDAGERRARELLVRDKAKVERLAAALESKGKLNAQDMMALLA